MTGDKWKNRELDEVPPRASWEMQTLLLMRPSSSQIIQISKYKLYDMKSI